MAPAADALLVPFHLQGISAIENMLGRPNVLNHLSVPAACFTHPEVSFVGVTQEKAEEMGKEQGFKVGVAKTSFKANSKVGGPGLGSRGVLLFHCCAVWHVVVLALQGRVASGNAPSCVLPMQV